jgi:predicted Zn-dependent peptidase
MKPHLVFAGILCALTAAAEAAAPTVHRQTLPSGIRVCYLHAKDSPGFSIFTFLPLGLASDNAGRTQWAHLIEHLVIRSTIPGKLKNVNAETLPDHMRLDFYGTRENWRDGLSHHARWLKGEPFTDVAVRDEPARANSEAVAVATRLATHKFATAAWNQVARHGRERVLVKGDLLNVDRATLEAYRDARLVIPDRTLICLIGGEDPAVVLTAVAEAVAGVKSAAKPGESKRVEPGNRQAQWDLNTRHVLLTWPIPGPDDDPSAHAALVVLGRLMWMQLAQDGQLQQAFGTVMLGTDLRCPESSYFFISAGVRDAEKPAEKLSERADAVLGDVGKLPQPLVAQVAAQLVAEMDVQDPAALRAQAPKTIEAGMIAAQVALTWGSAEYRLGAGREKVIQALRTMSAAQVRRAAEAHLKADRRTSLELVPLP